LCSGRRIQFLVSSSPAPGFGELFLRERGLPAGGSPGLRNDSCYHSGSSQEAPAHRFRPFVFSLHHHDEEDAAFVPATEPADPPIIDTIAQRHRLAKPKELCLNVHAYSRPHTSMARLARTVKEPSVNVRSRASTRQSVLSRPCESQNSYRQWLITPHVHRSTRAEP